MHAKQRKIVVLGHRGVGKTSLVTSYVTGQFPDRYNPTIENNYSTKVVTKKLQEYHLQVVDSAGLDELSEIPSIYAVNVDGYVLVYSVQSADSFRVVQSIYERLISTTGLVAGRIPVVLVASKIDLKQAPQSPVDLPPWLAASQSKSDGSSPVDMFDTLSTNSSVPRAVTGEQGRYLAAQWQAPYVETSALDGVNVAKVFELVAEQLKDADDGRYLMSLTGLNDRSSWMKRRPKLGHHFIKHSKHEPKTNSWWRKLMCTSSTATAESNM